MAEKYSGEYFSKTHNDIKLSKEEMEFLEKQFLKYLTQEMEKDVHAWKDYQDKFNKEQEQRTEYQENHQPTSGTQEQRDTGFKINTERTRQQYQQKDNNDFSKKDYSQYFAQKKQQEQNGNVHKNSSRDTPGRAHSNSRNGRSKQNHTPTNNENTQRQRDTANGSHTKEKESRKEDTQPPPTNKTSRKETKREAKRAKQASNRQQRNDDDIDQNKLYETSLLFKIFILLKNICVIFCCFVLMILLLVLRFVWTVLRMILKYAVLAIITLVGKLLKLWRYLDGRYSLAPKFFRYSNSVLELFHLITGFDIKSWVKRRRKNVKNDKDRPIIFPTTPVEAIKQLLEDKDSQPYRILCVNQDASNEEIKANYRKLARFVHPDKCDLDNADEAFKILDTAFKKISDSEKRIEIDGELEKQRQWEEFVSDDYKKMFDDLINSLPCGSCNGRHKRNLVKNRTVLEARYCGDCNTKHSANDNEMWAEENMLGLNWTCYACLDGEIYEVTEWAKCQNLKGALPVNFHKVTCRLSTQSTSKKGNGTRHNSFAGEGPSRRKGKKGRKQQKK